MDRSLRPCSLWDVKKHDNNVVDRLSSLPDELLAHILSLLPTKDAATVSLLSTRLRRVFPLITNLNFDASTIISHCVNRPYAVEKYPNFVSFVTSVLEAHRTEDLTNFRLKVGSADFYSMYYEGRGCLRGGWCKQDCLPRLEILLLSAWLSFPLTFRCLRVLDLCVLVREPGNAQLPPSIFTSQRLEVLKLELNIGLDQVLAMPSYSLPRLKVLFFSVYILSDDAFITRLLASSPVLEDLLYQPITEHIEHLIIRSISLRRLYLWVCKTLAFIGDNSDLVCIDTPNLEHFEYYDSIARRYSIILHNHCLVKAELLIYEWVPFEVELSFQQLINLITPLSHVQHLRLCGCILKVFKYTDINILKDRLPMFPNMKHLLIDGDLARLYWDKMLLLLLNCWPVLETLVMEKGIIDFFDIDYKYPKNELELEQIFFRRAHPILSCCRYHLKTIIIKNFLGKQREYDFIQFFLSHALVLENLIIHCLREPHSRLAEPYAIAPNHIMVENKLRNLPKASVSCAIQVL